MPQGSCEDAEIPIFDFFCVCGILDAPSGLWPLEEITDPEQLFSDPLKISYTPSVLEFAPKITSTGQPYAKECIPTFCFPQGSFLLIEEPEEEYRFHSFVITKENGETVYGGALSYPKKLLNVTTHTLSKGVRTIAAMLNLDEPSYVKNDLGVIEPKPLYCWECICLLSEMRYIQTTKNILISLLEIADTGAEAAFQSYIYNILFEAVSLPRNYDANLNLNSKTILCRGRSDTPALDCDIRFLFKIFKFDNLMKILSYCLLDMRIVVISSNTEILTNTTESLIYLMFPFTWCHPYIPILPKAMIDFLEAPTPFLMGVQKDLFSQLESSDLLGMVVIDCDKGTVSKIDSVLLPKTGELKKGVEEILGERIPSYRFGVKLRRLFTDYFADLLSGYEDFLFLPSDNDFTLFNATGESYLFDAVAFIAEQTEVRAEFLDAFIESQSFYYFLDLKYESSTVKKINQIVYFDRLISRKTILPPPINMVYTIPPASTSHDFITTKPGPIKICELSLDELPAQRNIVPFPSLNSSSTLSFDDPLALSPSSISKVNTFFLGTENVANQANPGQIHRQATSPIRRVSRAVGVVERKISSMGANQNDRKNSSLSSLLDVEELDIQAELSNGLFLNLDAVISKLCVSTTDWTNICSDLQLKKNSSELKNKKKQGGDLNRRASINTRALEGTIQQHKANAKHLPVTRENSLSEREPAALRLSFSQLSLNSDDEIDNESELKIEKEKRTSENLKKMKSHKSLLNSQINAEVNKLCSIIERIWSHGSLKGRGSWGLFFCESLDPLIVKERERIKAMFKIKTPLGIGRAFIRLSLQKCLLGDNIRILINDIENIKPNYKPYALLSQPDTKTRLLKSLKPLDKVTINIPSYGKKECTDEYKVSFYTSDVFNAGTSASVSVILIGLENKTESFTLPRVPKSFLRKSIEEFNITGKNLGELIAVVVGHDSKGISPTWHLNKITAESNLTGKQYLFTYNDWVQDNSTIVYLPVDKRISRENLGEFNEYDTQSLIELYLIKKSLQFKAITPVNSLQDLNSGTSSPSPSSRRRTIMNKTRSLDFRSANVSGVANRLSGMFSREKNSAENLNSSVSGMRTPPQTPVNSLIMVTMTDHLEHVTRCSLNLAAYFKNRNEAVESEEVHVLTCKRMLKEQFIVHLLNLLKEGFKSKRTFLNDYVLWDFICRIVPTESGTTEATKAEKYFKKSFDLIESAMVTDDSDRKLEVLVYLAISKGNLSDWLRFMKNHSCCHQFFTNESIFWSENSWHELMAMLDELNDCFIEVPVVLIETENNEI